MIVFDIPVSIAAIPRKKGNDWFGFMGFNATVNNISVISWRSVLLVEKTTTLSRN
jgi:hypothetical protein